MIKNFTKRNVPKRVLLLLLCLYYGFSAYAQTPSVKGEVKDKKETIVGATIIAQNIQKGTKTTTSSDKNGVFVFPRLAAGNYKFTISFIGYEPKTITGEVKDGGTFSLSVNLKESNIALDKEVIVTGTGINRNRNSFTGTTATFSGEALRAVGNNNVIQSLRSLDPSFILMENNLAGANPNVLPQIEVRGKTSVPTATLKDQFGGEPNQPLFILDGFETTLQNIVDLDINRVASVTILKDAASTALYGARASNGVVVVETLRPKSGELQFTYSNDLRIESPILSDYNMMNATEKLEFERLAGRYNYFVTPPDPSTQIYLEQLYNTHLAAVKRGVDTYWLNEAVQTGISENNSIFAQGGDNAFTYGLGFNYKNQTGAMKGSGRNTWSGNVNLTYRKGKININNILYVRGYQSSESPYGSFSNFVNANPYYIKDPSQRYLEISRTSVGASLKVRNPLYDAFLPNTNGSKNLEIQNNLQVNYNITPDLQLRGGMQIVKGSVTSELFRAPESSEFEDVAVLQRGKYTNNKTDNFSYQGNLLLTYGKVFGKHSVTANARAEINNRDYNSIEFIAEGFPEGSTGNPRFAYSYKANSAPTAASSVYRTANATLSANYAYDMRYLFDVSYRLDGSTAFGKNKQFSPYWSSGLGWNINKEKFLSNAKWINRLKLYANIGVTGNQNYGNITSVSVYNYNSSTNYNQFGQGVSLATLGNPDLQPQKTTQISTGIDYSFFNDRMTGYVSFYNKRTNPLVVAVDLPSSTGVFSYPLNVGQLNSKGMEFKIGYSPIYNIAKRIIWTVGVSGGFNKGKYEGFGNILRSLNKQQENNKSLLRFTDGYSPDDIWAAKSLGIDPATGREVFLTTDGQYTFDYALGNVQAVGNTNPIIEGVFNTSFGYKGFNLGFYVRYRLGGDIFNTALYDKVENISYSGIALNQDKRALYDRWQKPGDIAQFKGISQTSTTPMSSRFVQEENTITGESISMGYTFDRQKWLNKVGLKTLNLSAITNDLFRISTVKKERGIDYPFANTVSFSLKASF
ncbi:SusC/RagA family TonB-linked outer membrane protein [Pedobacter psychrodurus]|uniref:SusC/RagA family TonB-linked outer membrane protein n=1 Tax=Pedobacter psychrodurus TaxID=2530456 RepID=A0A4R0Q365_9SPHI|nr:SusC/RagA family TonB-linked outer membrane protein [Pedobacter psychrodurus]TCD29743.1 SusC/RagA family TonB-linked outer membrane protein [Pedobacter psychrodurus]